MSINYGDEIKLAYTHKVLLRYAELDIFPEHTKFLKEILTGQLGEKFLKGILLKTSIQRLHRLDHQICSEIRHNQEKREFFLAEKKKMYFMLVGLRIFTKRLAHMGGPINYPTHPGYWQELCAEPENLDYLYKTTLLLEGNVESLQS